ncbi:MAG: amidohydrolase family protein [Candidatus Hermodarchaeota archaeon]
MIIDGHAHFESKETVKARLERKDISKQQRAILQERMKNLSETKKTAQLWAESLEVTGCDKAVLMINNLDILKKVIDLYPPKFIGCMFVNPLETEMDNVLKLIQKALDNGVAAIKFHVSGLTKFYPAERKYDTLWEYLEEKQIPTYFHFGLTRYHTTRIAHPLELGEILSRYPKIPSIISHFGAGYLRDSLFLAYKYKSLYIDSSGRNTWLKYSGIPRLTLTDVFEMAIEAFGEDRVIFGTDSGFNSSGIRSHVLDMHSKAIKEAVTNLELGEKVWSKIMGENVARFLGISGN